ncbi:conserved hypothetical protein [Acinetobacter proteolyticus]|uniref:Uncharacterized protein n=1 Tax=Acinetobacter proteolyticus TaxID=1776741 RepID=A0A653K3N7_9GAMM|nr:hypothetical protein [Acinetobacter proteolyticus]VXA55454.1 conserved hypothetical protein [Acinetobacter proteolyticus]
MKSFKQMALSLNKNLICKKVETPRLPLYQVWDLKTGKQITDGNYSAVAAWHWAVTTLKEQS